MLVKIVHFRTHCDHILFVPVYDCDKCVVECS
jgi:hypothetical protein